MNKLSRRAAPVIAALALAGGGGALAALSITPAAVAYTVPTTTTTQTTPPPCNAPSWSFTQHPAPSIRVVKVEIFIDGRKVSTQTGYRIGGVVVKFHGDGVFQVVSFLNNGEVIQHIYSVGPGCSLQTAWVVLHKVIPGKR